MRAEKSSGSSEGAIELIGTSERYGVAIGVGLHELRKKLLTRLEAKPDWLRWTATEEGMTRQEK